MASSTPLRRFLADLIYEKIVDHSSAGNAMSDSFRCADAIIFEGRLVDREAFDYTAGARLHLSAPGWGFDGPFPDWLMENTQQIVDAAAEGAK